MSSTLSARAAAPGEPDHAGLSPRTRAARPIRPVRLTDRCTKAAVTALLVAFGIGVAACSSSPSSTLPSGTGSLHLTGVGSRSSAAVNLPNKWTATWHFNCANPTTASRFLLTASKQGGSSFTLTDQTGLGGGGSKAYTDAGTFVFHVATSCSWTLNAGATPTASSGSSSTSTT